MEDLTVFLRRMPKVELHVHLESTMPGEMLARFASRQGRELPRPAEQLYDCSAEDLSDFLAFLDRICAYVGTPQELAEAAEYAALAAREENILYSEMILNPTHWPQFTVPEIIAAVTEGFDRGRPPAAPTAGSRSPSPARRRERRRWHWRGPWRCTGRPVWQASLSTETRPSPAGPESGSARCFWRRRRRASAARSTPGRAAGPRGSGMPWTC